MSENQTTLLIIKPLVYQGEKLLKDQWQSFLDSIRTLLQQSGFEDEESSDELLLFTFNHPFAALTSVSTLLQNTKQTFSATAPEGASPIEIVLHLSQKDEILSPYHNADNPLWEMLAPENIYISRHLKASWDLLMGQKKLPPITIKNHGDGLSLLEINGQFEEQSETLLSFRGLPVENKGFKECFYCGMKSHKPGSCPSKFLSMTIDGLGEAGYLPFEKINMLYKKVFQEQDKLNNMLASGITPPQLKKNPGLITYVSYFDINRIFQLRFLWSMTFTLYIKWEAIFKADKQQIDNKNLQLGLDCLRVNQYAQAEELLLKENGHTNPKRFYATIGLAFIALERDRLSDMGTFLELATNMATQEKERIYVALLQSRYFELINEIWKARDVIKNVINLKPDCQATRYRQIQLEVKGNFTEAAFSQLRSIMAGQRQFYMLVLMDPALIPIQAKIENILSTQYFTLSHSSKNNLQLAKEDIEDLGQWLDKTDHQMALNLKTLDNLVKRYERKSYFDVLDVEIQAKALLSSGKTLRDQKLNELYTDVEKTTARWTGYYNFWKGYKYKGLFKKFKSQLMPLKKRLLKAHDLAKQSSSSTYREALTTVQEVKATLKILESTFSKMNFVYFAVTRSIDFGKKLAITEVVIVAVGFLVSACLGVVPKGTPISEFASFFSNPWVQKKAILFATIIFSPLLALSWLLMSLNKR